MEKINSINQNGCSVCPKGKEYFTTFTPAHQRGKKFYQYDYRHRDGELFTTVAPTLEQCREKRDKWLQAKNYKRLFPSILKQIEDNKRLTKCDMAYQIGHVEPLNVTAVSWDLLKREDIVLTFNQLFGTEIK